MAPAAMVGATQRRQRRQRRSAVVVVVLAPISTFWKLKKIMHLISLGGNIPCADTLVVLVLANFGVFMVNFEKNVRFGGLTGILATFFGRYARKNAL